MKLIAAAAIGFVAGAITSGLLSGWLRVAPYLVHRERVAGDALEFQVLVA